MLRLAPTDRRMTPTKPRRGRGNWSPTGGPTAQIRVGSELARRLRARARERKTTVAVVVAEKDF